MSYVTISYLYCDGPLCATERAAMFHGVGPSETIAMQRKRAKDHSGWHVAEPGGKDYCEECWAERLNRIRNGML